MVPHREVLSSHHTGNEIGPEKLLCCPSGVHTASPVVAPSPHLFVFYLEGPVVGRCALRYMCAEDDDRFTISAFPPNFHFEPPFPPG